MDVTNISSDIDKDDTRIIVNDASSIYINTYIDLEGEELYVVEKTGNTLTVQRGQDATTITPHLSGAPIKSITSADDLLIEEGDNFGFDGSLT